MLWYMPENPVPAYISQTVCWFWPWQTALERYLPCNWVLNMLIEVFTDWLIFDDVIWKKNELCNKRLYILYFDRVSRKRQVPQYIGKLKCIPQHLPIDYS